MQIKWASLPDISRNSFVACTPHSWHRETEARFLNDRFDKLPGYAPLADVLLALNAGLRRLWIEFEVSRAEARY